MLILLPPPRSNLFPYTTLFRSSPTQRIAIPHTLLISALGRVPDVRQCVTMVLKELGNDLYLVGVTKDELGGSHLHLRSEEHTSELQSRFDLVCRLLLEKKKKKL